MLSLEEKIGHRLNEEMIDFWIRVFIGVSIFAIIVFFTYPRS